jgi:hypothetical protein
MKLLFSRIRPTGWHWKNRQANGYDHENKGKRVNDITGMEHNTGKEKG